MNASRSYGPARRTGKIRHPTFDRVGGPSRWRVEWPRPGPAMPAPRGRTNGAPDRSAADDPSGRKTSGGSASDGGEKVGPGAEAPGSVSTVTLPQDAYAARRASMTTLSLAFRVLAKCSKQGSPASNRSSPYRQPHRPAPKCKRTRDPFTAQSILFRPHQKPNCTGPMGSWWRRRSTALRVLKRYYEPVINRRSDIGEIAARVQSARYPAAPVSRANQSA